MGNALLLVLLVHLSLRLVASPGAPAHGSSQRSSPSAVLLAAAAAGLWLEPVFQTIVFGQINLLLACLVLWDLGRPEGARGKGFAVGVAAGIKLTPAIFAVYLLLTGRVTGRAHGARRASPPPSPWARSYCPPPSCRVLDAPHLRDGAGRQGVDRRQPVAPRAGRPPRCTPPTRASLWRLPAAARRRGRAGARAARCTCGTAWTAGAWWSRAFTALLVSPISWSHHWVWCVPLLVLLAACAGPVVAVVVVRALHGADPVAGPEGGHLDLRLTWWAQPLASPYPLLTLALLAAVAVRCYSVSGSADGLSGLVLRGLGPGLRRGSGSPASSSSASTIRYAYPCSARKRWRCAAKSWSMVSRATTE